MILFLWAFFTPSSHLQAAGTYGKKEDLFDSEKAIAVDAQIIAQARLAKNKKDKLALTLVDFSHHLHPTYEPLLLIRGKLKYNLPIASPKQKGTGESEFILNLKKRAKKLTDTNNIRDRHLSLVYYTIIRLFEPEYERAIIQLMKLTDQGETIELPKLLRKKFSTIPYHELDSKDPRYAVGNLEKTIEVRAGDPWTDSWIKVEQGKVIKIEAKRFWTLGSDGTFPYTDADGFDNISLQQLVDKGNRGKGDKTYHNKYRAPKFVTRKLAGKKDMKPGSLLVKIGKLVYPAGKNVTFRAESSGILSLGPFEWDSYSDNSGYLLVTIKVSDK